MGGFAYLLEIGLEVGLYQQSWQELSGWITATGARLEAWEITAIREMAHAYTMAIGEFADKHAPAPYFDGVIDRLSVEQEVKRALKRK